MKKLSILSLALVILSVSCKKSSSGSSASYHVTATVGGTAETFNISPKATTQTVGGITQISVVGIASSSTGESVSISVDNSPSSSPIVAGTYSDTTSKFNIEGSYNTYLGGPLYIGGTSETATGVAVGAPVTNHTKIVITSIDAQGIKGTFSGDFYANGDLSAAKKTITNGDFYAKF